MIYDFAIVSKVTIESIVSKASTASKALFKK